MAQWIRRRSPKPKIGGSSPPVGKTIFIPEIKYWIFTSLKTNCLQDNSRNMTFHFVRQKFTNEYIINKISFYVLFVNLLVNTKLWYARTDASKHFNTGFNLYSLVLFMVSTVPSLKGPFTCLGFFHGKLNSPCAVEWY